MGVSISKKGRRRERRHRRRFLPRLLASLLTGCLLAVTDFKIDRLCLVQLLTASFSRQLIAHCSLPAPCTDASHNKEHTKAYGTMHLDIYSHISFSPPARSPFPPFLSSDATPNSGSVRCSPCLGLSVYLHHSFLVGASFPLVVFIPSTLVIYNK